MNIESRVLEKPIGIRVKTWWALLPIYQRIIIGIAGAIFIFTAFRVSQENLGDCPLAPLQVFVLTGQATMLGFSKSNTPRI